MVDSKLQEAYLTLHKACGIEVGDMVKVLRKAKRKEMGWFHSWSCHMDHLIGEEFDVREDRGNGGFEIWDEDADQAWVVPFFVLEKVGPAPIKIGGRVVMFREGQINVEKEPGSISTLAISNDKVREIADRLID